MKKLLSLLLVAVAAHVLWAQPVCKAPQFLRAGDKIAVIAPSSAAPSKYFDDGCSALRSWGLVPVVGPNAKKQYHLWAGTVEQRKNDLLWALRDTTIKAIMCVRGGYGASQLLYEIPLDTLKRYGGKWLVGYSDITALHSGLVCAGHMSIHGSMCGRLAKTGGTDSLSVMLRDLLFGTLPRHTVKGHKWNVPGHAQGVLIGGNLSVLVNFAGGAPYDFLDRDFIKDKDIILFFEDVSESISRVSSMFYQLKVRGIIDHVRGIIVGHFDEYEPSKGYADMCDMLHEFMGRNDIPICYDFPTSHDEQVNYPLIEGCPVTLNVTEKSVTLDFNR
ncbi:MAG: LD-carboxypeptidase [Muribaculaceae bacterium]|nr:LD-carboxypeptidase [Muribaculaceae bacterium]